MLSAVGDRFHLGVAICRYVAAGGPAEPVELFGQLAAAGIRLRCGESGLLAEVSEATIADSSWAALDRRLSRYAGSLALTVSLARRSVLAVHRSESRRRWRTCARRCRRSCSTRWVAPTALRR